MCRSHIQVLGAIEKHKMNTKSLDIQKIKKTINEVCLILAIYLLWSLFLGRNFYEIPNSLNTLPFLIFTLGILYYLFLLLTILFTKQEKLIGWKLLTIFLIFKLTVVIINLFIESFNPSDIFINPDNFYRTSVTERRLEAFLVLFIPLIIWISLLWKTQKADFIEYFGVHKTMRRRIIFSTVFVALTFKIGLWTLNSIN